MTLGIAEHPQLMETVVYAMQHTQYALTTTIIRHASALVVVILKQVPVNRNEATDKVNPTKGILGLTQALVLSRIAGKWKLATKNNGINTFQHEVLEHRV